MIFRDRRLYIAALWLAAAFAFIMATLPKPPVLPGTPSDKVQHILAFAVLTGLAFAAWGQTAGTKIVVALSTFGALIEIVQAIPALHRDSSWLDWMTDIGAVLVVAGAASLKNSAPNRQKARQADE